MKGDPMPKSEWAELFVSLSKRDTSDTIDKRSANAPEPGPSVATVKSDSDSSEGLPEWKNPAEILDIRDTSKPFVASVSSVILENEQETRGRQPTRFPAADTSATVATQGDSLDERAAIIELGNIPRRWAEGFTALSTMPAPAGFAPERWRRIVDATGTFLDRWAVEATRCGWNDLDMFGVNLNRPDARFDAMGVILLLDRAEVVGVDPEGADLVTVTGAHQRYRRRALPPDTVTLWDLMIAERGSDAD